METVSCLDAKLKKYIQVTPKTLKEIAQKIEYQAENARGNEKIMYELAGDIVLYFDPKGEGK